MKLIGLAVVVVVVVFEALNFTGFCYHRARWPDDRDLVDAVIQYEIDHINPRELAGGAKKYTSVDEFRRINPICCRLSKWGDPYVRFWRRPMVWVRRILGQEILIADLWYRFKDNGPEPFTMSHYLIDACGNVREAGHGGSANTRTGPTRAWEEGP